MELGSIETTPGAGGGVKFVPYISDEKVRELQEEPVSYTHLDVYKRQV